jgi:transmembrane sensor
MAKREAADSFNSQILDEASVWFVELNEAQSDGQLRAQFAQWLRRSPEHVHAYLEISALWEDARLLERTRRDSMSGLVALARSEPDVARLAMRSAREPKVVQRRSRRKLAAAAVIAGLSVAAAVLAWLQVPASASYAADVGERRSIVLADGSTVDLNSRSRVRVRYTEAERFVDLVEGQALFHVAKDAARPFIVRSGATRVRAVGTAFDVYQRRSGTVVTVVEGKVDISGRRDSQRAIAGERVIAKAESIAKPERADIPAATAWIQRKLIFDSTPLPEVIDELNRYSTRPLVLGDERLKEFHVSGVFSSTSPDGFVQFLRRRFDVEIIESDGEIRIEPRR